MRADVALDFAWQRQFIPQMAAIAGQHLAVHEAPFEDDTERNTDLLVLAVEGNGIRIACRTRRNHQLQRYGDQFTIRTFRPNGARTELAKILDGWGDYLLYGFATKVLVSSWTPRFVNWTLADLNVFRARYQKNMGERVRNRDGTQGRAFEWAWFPPEFVIASNRISQPALAVGNRVERMIPPASAVTP